ncbi:hypothetical protein A4E84_03395 [Streptomyces qaidamensis]|uniref:Uncharacterized protein n=1 Tax=Streptomyces qaidamensis TaxID=1783515 RepID=A0A143BTT7_9ACTN|nr:hypothetical protein A4E84_03395 [Streptomyces qaidamensis]
MPKLPSVWKGGWLQNRLGSVLYVSRPRSMIPARCPSPGRAKRAARQGQVHERRLSPDTVPAVNGTPSFSPQRALSETRAAAAKSGVLGVI